MSTSGGCPGLNMQFNKIRILSQILLHRKGSLVRSGFLIRLSVLVALVVVVTLSTGSDHRRELPAQSMSSPQQSSLLPTLPSGMVRSDWDGILLAHEEWKHEVRASGSGWKAHNTATGLTADFDRRGLEVRPESGSWSWGLELTSYGIGAMQRPIEGKAAAVRTEARRVTYDWDKVITHGVRLAGMEELLTPSN
jgi:hypothetical protein